MVIIDGLSPGDELPVPMVFTVTSVNWQAGKSRRAAVVLKDSAGDLIQLVDYEGAKMSVQWRENHRYRIFRCSVQRGGQGFALQLSPSQRTRIEPLGPVAGARQILVIGDTHVGRTKHPGTGEEIDPISAFEIAVDYGLDQGIDAAVHVGDIFHESATRSQATRVDKRVFEPLSKSGIPFYYVRGNHSSEYGERILTDRDSSLIGVLDTGGVTVGSEIRLFGIDHYPQGDLPWSDLRFPKAVTESVSILVLHQTLEQLSGPGPKSVDVERIQRNFPGRFDFVLSGHQHNAVRKKVRGAPVLYTGSVENEYKRESN